MLTHSVGCLPKSAHDALESGFLQPWATLGADAWPVWLQQVDGFRSALVDLFGGVPDEYCPQVNLSSGLIKLLLALPDGPAIRRVLLAAEDTFPSLGFVLQQAQRCGYELRLISRQQDPGELQTWSAALTDDVRAALVTHVHSTTGRVAPVAEIARLCAERDIVCLLDVAQSAGILPIRFPDCGVPIVLGSCVKWLCGGPGAGFLWIRADWIERLRPIDVGWFSHADPFEFDIHSFEYAPDARRFWGGTPSIAPFVVATAGLRLVHSVGVDSIRLHNRKLTQAFAEALPARWRNRMPTGNIGGTLCIPTGEALGAVRAALSAAGVRFDCRGDVVRISFHICNRLEDAQRVARAWQEGCSRAHES